MEVQIINSKKWLSNGALTPVTGALTLVKDGDRLHMQKSMSSHRCLQTSMKDITDTVNDVCMVRHLARLCDCCYVTKWVTITSTLCRLLFVPYITITSALLHVPYKSELIITDVHTDVALRYM